MFIVIGKLSERRRKWCPYSRDSRSYVTEENFIPLPLKGYLGVRCVTENQFLSLFHSHWGKGTEEYALC
jgi:hypothetical protein